MEELKHNEEREASHRTNLEVALELSDE